jgi:hypothetical protein
MYMNILRACVCVCVCVCVYPWMLEKSMSDLLTLELQIVVNCHMGAMNPTQVLYSSNK